MANLLKKTQAHKIKTLRFYLIKILLITWESSYLIELPEIESGERVYRAAGVLTKTYD
jgi:hypothetical protein